MLLSLSINSYLDFAFVILDFEVYPKVMVRQQEEEQDDTGSSLFIRVTESLSLQDHHPSDGTYNICIPQFVIYYVMEV